MGLFPSHGTAPLFRARRHNTKSRCPNRVAASLRMCQDPTQLDCVVNMISGLASAASHYFSSSPPQAARRRQCKFSRVSRRATTIV
jgi:hypothetical protein